MSSRTRVLEALERRIPDIIPFHAYESPENAIRQLGRKVHEMHLDMELVPQAMIHTAKLYHNDIIYLRHSVFHPEDHLITPDADGLLVKSKKSGEIIGRVYHDTKEFIPTSRPEPPMKSIRDIDKIPIIPAEEIVASPHMQSMKGIVDEFKGKRFIFGFAAAQSANILDRSLGTEESMIATIEDRGLCRAIMDRQYEAKKQEMLAMKMLGVDGIYTGDASASCSFYPPATYRELFFEYHKKGIEFAHRIGMKALLHICGRNSEILEDMAATGADIIESLDAFSAAGNIDLADAKRRVGDKVCLKGNIDAVGVLQRQSAEKVYEKCMEAMRDAGPNGYVLSTEQITRDTPPEKVLAMVQARDDYSAQMHR